MIRVQAFFPLPRGFGFYGTRRRFDGDVFQINDEKEFSEKWMKKARGRPALEPEKDKGA